LTAYTVIADSEIDPESPGTTTLFTKLRNNPIAISEGSSGAPPILDAALDTTVTAAGTTWVQNRIAGSSVDDIGTYIFASGADTAQGSTIAGSGLTPTSGARRWDNGDGVTPIDISFDTGSTLSGTWRCMGYSDASAVSSGCTLYGATLWLRIS